MASEIDVRSWPDSGRNVAHQQKIARRERYLDEVRFLAILILSCGCVPKVSMIIETRTPQGTVIQRGTVTNSDTADHPFTIDAGGSIFVSASADDSNGLASLYVTGGNSCGQAGQTQQGVFTGTDPNLPGQHPTSSSFTATFPLQCSGGTFTGSMMACAANTKQSQSCTPNATFK